MFLQKLYYWFFNVSEHQRDAIKILLWWEKRRIPFNILIAVVGLSSLILLNIFVNASVKKSGGEDVVEPALIFTFPVLLNIAYSLGWIVEIANYVNNKIDDPTLGQWLLRTGTFLTLVVVTLPTIVWGVIFVFNKLGISN